MDPITIGVGVGMAVVSQVTKKLLEKAADPAKVASSVNWLFLAAAHLFKIRKKEVTAETTIARPPEAGAMEVPPIITDVVVEEKRAAVQEIAGSLKKESAAPGPVEGGIHVKTLDDFTADQIVQEVTSLLNQLDTYLRNLRFEEQKAAQYGGLDFAPVIIMNTVRIQRKEIGLRLLRLNTAVTRAFGVTAPDLDLLVAALNE